MIQRSERHQHPHLVCTRARTQGIYIYTHIYVCVWMCGVYHTSTGGRCFIHSTRTNEMNVKCDSSTSRRRRRGGRGGVVHRRAHARQPYLATTRIGQGVINSNEKKRRKPEEAGSTPRSEISLSRALSPACCQLPPSSLHLTATPTPLPSSLFFANPFSEALIDTPLTRFIPHHSSFKR